LEKSSLASKIRVKPPQLELEEIEKSCAFLFIGVKEEKLVQSQKKQNPDFLEKPERA